MPSQPRGKPVTRRTFLSHTGALAASSWLAGCSSSAPTERTVSRTSSDIELVMLGGDIHTVAADDRHVSALAIANGRIVATGTDEQIRSLMGNRTQRIDLRGRTVLPGINDSHLHLQMWSLNLPPFAIDVTSPAVNSIADCVALVGKAAAAKPPSEWIIGRGWDQAYLQENRAPTAQDLDAVSADNPVALVDFSGHAMWANSIALKLAGIDRNSVPPAGGVIVKDANGDPTGVLLEGAAWHLRNSIPRASRATRKAAIAAGMQKLLARGITSATEPGLLADELALFGEIAAEQGTPRLRMTGLIKAGTNRAQLADALGELKDLPQGDRAFMHYAGVKIMGDGIPTGNKTAWLHEPYEEGGNGSMLLDGDTHRERSAEVRAMIDLIHRAGLQAGTHVTGDRSIDTVIAAYVASQGNTSQPDPRHYIIHADLVSPGTLQTMRTHRIGANFNPEIKHLIADSQVQSIGVERAAYEWPFRTAIDSGVNVACSSDAPVTAGNWLQGLATCVNRLGKQSGKISGPAQRISLDEAVRTYTMAGAWQDHAEAFKGSLTPGKVADLCILDSQLASIDSTQYTNSKVIMTMVDGKIVYNSGV